MNKLEFIDSLHSEEELANYDFKNVIIDTDYNYNDENNIENFLNYKILGKYDCDKIYGEIFGIENTDTLNSYWTLFKKYAQLNLSNELDLENGNIKNTYLDKYKEQYGSDLSSSQLWCLHINNMIKEKNISIDEDFVDFAKLTHTIGNFMEVPKGFNVNRYTNTFDYMDLTLLCIYKWYETGSDFWLEVLLNDNREAIENTKEWLLKYDTDTHKEFSAWQKFIILEDLTDYVNSDYKPKELFTNHFNNFEILINNKSKFENYYEKEKLLNPQNIFDLSLCVERINNIIKDRGVQKAKNELEEIKNELEKIKNESVKDINKEFDSIIVTSKTGVNFPIVADILTYSQFYQIATSEQGLTIKGTCYFDIDLLDEELYKDLKDSFIEDKVAFFRVNPMWVTDKILEWNMN